MAESVIHSESYRQQRPVALATGTAAAATVAATIPSLATIYCCTDIPVTIVISQHVRGRIFIIIVIIIRC